jgi:hypothetical protein
MYAMSASRNDPRGFAARTLKNLDYIMRANPDDVHVVAQTGNSLLGLIIFPIAKGLHQQIKSRKMDDLVNEGWPAWNYPDGGSCATLGDLVLKLRHAVAHGHWRFTSESRDCSAVRLEVELPQSWKADIGCLELQLFCRKFVELLEPS